MRPSLPLVVDLDGTLLLTDSLHEQIVFGLFSNPLALLACLPSLLRGRAAFKTALAENVTFDVQAMPLREPFLAWLGARREDGMALHLCTAAHHSVAQGVAAR